MSTGGAVMLYDGTCGLCASSVQFILRHERQRSLRFAPLQGAFAKAVRSRHPELHDVDSMVWVEPARQGAVESTYVRSAAVLRAAQYVGGAWRLAAIGWIVPRPLRDAIYNFVARHRHRVFGAEQCYLPPPDVRARFIE
jgi:predicted DCC family thiol-disulfide oxidoreductase YuxK